MRDKMDLEDQRDDRDSWLRSLQAKEKRINELETKINKLVSVLRIHGIWVDYENPENFELFYGDDDE